MVSVGIDAKAANFPVGVVENGEMCHPRQSRSAATLEGSGVRVGRNKLRAAKMSPWYVLMLLTRPARPPARGVLYTDVLTPSYDARRTKHPTPPK